MYFVPFLKVTYPGQVTNALCTFLFLNAYVKNNPRQYLKSEKQSTRYIIIIIIVIKRRISGITLWQHRVLFLNHSRSKTRLRALPHPLQHLPGENCGRRTEWAWPLSIGGRTITNLRFADEYTVIWWSALTRRPQPSASRPMQRRPNLWPTTPMASSLTSEWTLMYIHPFNKNVDIYL